MKKITTICIAALSFISGSALSAQAQQSNVTVTSFNPKVNITVESCYRDGKDVTINYTLTNNWGEFSIHALGCFSGSLASDAKYTGVYDNLGNSYKLRYITFGNEYTDPLYKTVTFSPPIGVPIKGTIEVANVNSKATSFPLVQIVGELMPKLTPIGFTVKNLPIQPWEQLYSSDVEAKKVEKPYMEKIIDKNESIKSVSITNNNTKVAITYTRGENTPSGSLWLNTTDNDISLEVDGKKYELLQFYGLGRRENDNSFVHGNTFDYTLVFEKIPDNTEVFDLHQKGGGFYNVFVNPPENPTKYDLKIAPIKSIVSIKDVKTAHSQRKRITQPERTALRIDYIRNNEYINSAWQNNVLSKGAQIYKGANGSLETVMLIVNGKGVNEYLMSYNSKGEFVDCLPIGLINPENNARSEGSVQGSLVTTRVFDGKDSYGFLYRITYNGRFIKIKEWKINE